MPEFIYSVALHQMFVALQLVLGRVTRRTRGEPVRQTFPQLTTASTMLLHSLGLGLRFPAKPLK
jgi:hypothetical protein